MPPKSPPKKKSKKRKIKIAKEPRFTKEELNEEIDIFLTCHNPYMSQNCVEFDLKTQAFKPIWDFRKPVFCYRKVGASKQQLTGRYGVYYEEVPINAEEKMRNKFNFRSVGTQTEAPNPKDQNEYIDPNLHVVLKFEGAVTKEEILKAYLENEEMKATEGENDRWLKADVPTLVKRVGRKELALKDCCRRYLRLCERMADQNMSEANLDFDFYDNPNDEFTPNVGSLLPLWRLGYRSVQGMTVTGLSWSTFYTDLFAVGFRAAPGKDDDEEDVDEDDLGSIREKGCTCVLSLKGPSYPERIFPCLWGVSDVAFHPSDPHLLAVVSTGGSVTVYDLRRKDDNARGQDSKFQKFHHVDLVAEAKWLPDKIPQKLCSVSLDGKIINWLFLLNDLFPADVVTALTIKDRPIAPPPKGLEMTLEPTEKAGEDLGLNICGTTLSVHPNDRELFLVGTETGLIHLGSFDDKACNATYRGHRNYIHRVHWNRLHPRVFLSCSKDYTLQIWDHAEKQPIFEFFFENEVRDVAWAPFSTTLFAAILGNAVVSVFDLAVDKIKALGSFTCYTPKQNIHLTRLTFHPKKPVLLLGDDRGCVILLKLSPNLRSSLKALETLEKSKFVAGEIEKLEKLLTAAKIRSEPASTS